MFSSLSTPCDARDCASSAKSQVVFDDGSDLSGKTVQVTVPRLYERKMVFQ